MAEKYRNNQNSVEINDLIDDAVNHAIARRYQAMNPEENLCDLSPQEMKDVVGGIIASPVLSGKIIIDLPCPTIGIIYQPEKFLLA